MPMQLLEMGHAAWSIMPTFFAATLSAGLSVKAAYLVQGLAMLMVLSGVAWVWMRKANLALRGSVLTLGLLLFTPYAFVYELALLALPLCWLWEEGRVRGRLPGELILLLFGWLMPYAAPFCGTRLISSTGNYKSARWFYWRFLSALPGKAKWPVKIGPGMEESGLKQSSPNQISI